jgi:hypothetical protein
VTVEFREPTEADILYVAANMRKQDQIEVRLSNGFSPIEAVRQGCATGNAATFVINGVACAIFGAERDGLLSDVAVLWLLGTDDLFKHPKQLVKYGRKVVTALFDRYSLLYNYVHVNNDASIRWLKSMGFEFQEPEMYGVYKSKFVKFEGSR